MGTGAQPTQDPWLWAQAPCTLLLYHEQNGLVTTCLSCTSPRNPVALGLFSLEERKDICQRHGNLEQLNILNPVSLPEKADPESK